MTRREQILTLVLLVVVAAGLASESRFGTRNKDRRPIEPSSLGPDACPEGFVPRNRNLHLPDAPPGEFRLAESKPVLEECVLLTGPEAE